MANNVSAHNGAFRAGVAKLGLGYVLAVSCDHRIPAWPGGKRRLRAGRIAAALPAGAWHRISAGTGSKGPRWYDWAWVCAHQPGHSLLIRRLFNGLVITPLWAQMTPQLRAISDTQHWSTWWRHHQGQARRSHYQHRLTTELGP